MGEFGVSYALSILRFLVMVANQGILGEIITIEFDEAHICHNDFKESGALDILLVGLCGSKRVART